MAAAAGDASVGVEPNAENKLFIGGMHRFELIASLRLLLLLLHACYP
jgi:hypothetical protein